MPQDFFGYDRTVGSTNVIASAEALVVSGGGIGSDLMQEVNMTYGQTIRPLFAVGNSNIYFVGGQSQGQLAFRRLSACGSMLKGLGGNCGRLGASISLAAGGSGTSCFCAPGGATLGDPVLQNVSVNVRAGQIEIYEGGQIIFGTLNT
jgi:hypothetical protein